MNVRYDIMRGGAKLCELEAQDGVAIRMQAGAKVKTALSGTFRLDDRVDFLSDIIRPMLFENGGWLPMGYFLAANVTEDCVDDTAWVQIDARDYGSVVQRRTTESGFALPAGMLYTEAVQQVLTTCGIEKVRSVPGEARLQTDRADWEIGTSYLDIADQLLLECGYEDLWWDNEGYARVEPRWTGLAQHVYRTDEVSVLDAAYQLESNAYSAYNVFMALVSSPDLESPLYAIAENNDPVSPLSTIRRGRIPMPIMKIDNIAGQEELQAYVDAVRNQSLISTQTVSFTTAIRRHGVGDLIYLDHHRAKGVWRETDWTITLGPGGQMSHQAKKEVLL